MSKEKSPEEKRLTQIRGEIIGLHRQIEKLQIEKWQLEGCPPIPVTVYYDDGSEEFVEEILYTKGHYDNGKWLSPESSKNWKYGQELKGKIKNV